MSQDAFIILRTDQISRIASDRPPGANPALTPAQEALKKVLCAKTPVERLKAAIVFFNDHIDGGWIGDKKLQESGAIPSNWPDDQKTLVSGIESGCLWIPC